jgi:hypothetical protein
MSPPKPTTRWVPCKRREFIRKVRRLGFEGPQPGARHQVMYRGKARLVIPNNVEYSVPQVRQLVAEVAALLGREIDLAEWSDL